MTIAKGLTNCKAERDFVLQGFYEQLQILEEVQIEQGSLFKSHLYDIITDLSTDAEEKLGLKHPWILQLQELEERNIRVRRSVFIGLYSFWEVSLMDIAFTYRDVDAYIEKLDKKKSKKIGTSDYLKLIYEGVIPSSTQIINDNIRKLRNYMVHGSMTENREKAIIDLMKMHPEFCIKHNCRSYYIGEYIGLKAIIELFAKELDNAEMKVLETDKNNIQ